MTRPLYYDRDLTPISRWRWTELYEDDAYRRVGDDDILTPSGDVLWVSTVWLGIDHASPGSPPIVFETMVFGGPAGGELQWRYRDEAAARAGHARVVAALRAGVALDDLDAVMADGTVA